MDGVGTGAGLEVGAIVFVGGGVGFCCCGVGTTGFVCGVNVGLGICVGDVDEGVFVDGGAMICAGDAMVFIGAFAAGEGLVAGTIVLGVVAAAGTVGD